MWIFFAKSLKLARETSMEEVSTSYLVSMPNTCMVTMATRGGHWLAWNWSYRCLCTAMWVSEQNVGPLPEKQSLMDAELSLQPRCEHYKFWVSWIIQNTLWSELQYLFSDGYSFPSWESTAAQAGHIHCTGMLRVYFQGYSELCIVFSIENKIIVHCEYSTFSKNSISCWSVVAHSFNSSTLKSEAGRSPWIWGQPCLQSEF